MKPDYYEPAWLFNPPEDDREIVGYCEYCSEEIRTGDTVYYNINDWTVWYCCEDCFKTCEMRKKEV